MRSIIAVFLLSIASMVMAQSEKQGAEQEQPAKNPCADPCRNLPSTPLPPITINVSPSQTLNTGPDKKTEHVDDKTWERVTGIATAVLALFTIVLAGYAIAQRYDLKENSQRELRAYVAFDAIYFPWVPNPDDPSDKTTIVSDSYCKVRIRNFGKTPANDVTLRLSGAYASNYGDFQRLYGGRDYLGPRLRLSPDQSYTTRVSPDRFTFDPNIPRNADGNDPYVFGAVVYEDVFGAWWLSEFCFHYDTESKNRFIPHWHGNQERKYKTRDKALDALLYSLPPGPYTGTRGKT